MAFELTRTVFLAIFVPLNLTVFACFIHVAYNLFSCIDVWSSTNNQTVTTQSSVTCKIYEHFDSVSGKCVKNVCKCSFGRVNGTECLKHDAEKCVEGSCDEGYNFKNGRCEENECPCSNGEGLRGLDCNKNNDENCKKCNEGYHLEETKEWIFSNYQKVCSTNTCKCEDYSGTIGESIEGPPCKEQGGQYCKNCKEGYHPVQENSENPSCEKNVCRCEDEQGNTVGTAATGKECLQDNTIQCKDCSLRLDLVLNTANKCQENTCRCPNGIAHKCLDGDVNNKQIQCSSCQSTYFLYNRRCTIKCVCPNGTPAKGSICYNNNNNLINSSGIRPLCSTCNMYYDLISNRRACVLSNTNICMCKLNWKNPSLTNCEKMIAQTPYQCNICNNINYGISFGAIQKMDYFGIHNDFMYSNQYCIPKDLLN